MAIAASVQAALTLLSLELVITDGKTWLRGSSGTVNGKWGSDFRTDLGPPVAATPQWVADKEYFQLRVWQRGFQRRRGAKADWLIRARVEIDFWERLTDIHNSTAIIGPSPQGQASKDWEKYASSRTWENPTGFLANASETYFGMDLDVEPEVGIERIGHFHHWWTYFDLLLHQ